MGFGAKLLSITGLRRSSLSLVMQLLLSLVFLAACKTTRIPNPEYQRSYNIAIVPDIPHLLNFKPIMKAARSKAEEYGNINFFYNLDQGPGPEGQISVLRAILTAEERIDALIIFISNAEPLGDLLVELRDRGILVLTSGYSLDPQIYDINLQASKLDSLAATLIESVIERLLPGPESSDGLALVSAVDYSGFYADLVRSIKNYLLQRRQQKLVLNRLIVVNTDLSNAYGQIKDLVQDPHIKAIISLDPISLEMLARSLMASGRAREIIASGLGWESTANLYLETGAIQSMVKLENPKYVQVLIQLAYEVLTGIKTIREWPSSVVSSSENRTLDTKSTLIFGEPSLLNSYYR